MINVQINNEIARQMKKIGLFGDYILAKRLQPTFRRYSVLPLKYFINDTLSRDTTPQGYYFWQSIYRKI